jgi:hypothetical protein
MARSDPQVNLRIPAELKADVDAAAEASGRSMNAEVVYRLGLSFDRPQEEGELMSAYERSEEYVKALQGQVNLATRLASLSEGTSALMADRLRLLLAVLPKELFDVPEVAHVKRYYEAWMKRDAVAMAQELALMLPADAATGLAEHARMIEDEKSRGDHSRIERVVDRLSEPLPPPTDAAVTKRRPRKSPKG